jgi:hypothetical protein
MFYQYIPALVLMASMVFGFLLNHLLSPGREED